jgi:hypothetical protein
MADHVAEIREAPEQGLSVAQVSMGSVSYGPVLNAAAILLSCFGNVPAERSARLIGMLTGQDVSSGWIDKAVARMNAGLVKAGSDEAMLAALAAEDVLAADETPVNVVGKTPLPSRNPGTPARRTRRRRPGRRKTRRPPRGRRTCWSSRPRTGG